MNQRYRLRSNRKIRNRTSQSREKWRNACVRMKRVRILPKRIRHAKKSRNKRVTVRTWSWIKKGRGLLLARATQSTTTAANRYFLERCTTLWLRPSRKSAPPKLKNSSSSHSHSKTTPHNQPKPTAKKNNANGVTSTAVPTSKSRN